MLETEKHSDVRVGNIVLHDDLIRRLQPNEEGQNRGDWLGLMLVLARGKKQILLITVAGAFLATIIAFLLPKMYTATSVILPPQQSQSASTALLGQLGAMVGLNAQDLGVRNPADMFVVMLKGRTIADHLVDRFDLRKVYRVKTYQDARKKLAVHSTIDAGDEGLISISVTDRDPARAAEMANGYVEELHSLNASLAVGEAAERRLFYEQKLDTERQELSRADLALKQVEEKSGLIQPDAQGKAVIEAVADMRAQVAVHEVQLQAMRTFATENNPDVKRAEEELAGLRGQLAKLERNTPRSGGANGELTTHQMPAMQLEYIERARDLKYHEALYEFLSKQLEAARIDEAKNAVIVQVVDKAVKPEKKSSPRRLLIIVMSAACAFVLACTWILAMEAFHRKQQDPSERERLDQLRQSLSLSSWKS